MHSHTETEDTAVDRQTDRRGSDGCTCLSRWGVSIQWQQQQRAPAAAVLYYGCTCCTAHQRTGIYVPDVTRYAVGRTFHHNIKPGHRTVVTDVWSSWLFTPHCRPDFAFSTSERVGCFLRKQIRSPTNLLLATFTHDGELAPPTERKAGSNSSSCSYPLPQTKNY